METDTWNKYRKNNNCYAFAFDKLNPDADSKLQPGELSDQEPLNDKHYTCPALVARVQQDHPDVAVATAQPCPPDAYRVALFLDNEGEKRDYHFYRELAPGRWAHKPGSLPVSFVDDSGALIQNPVLADRDYVNNGPEGSGYNYAQYCGAFCVPRAPAVSPVLWWVTAVVCGLVLAWLAAQLL